MRLDVPSATASRTPRLRLRCRKTCRTLMCRMSCRAIKGMVHLFDGVHITLSILCKRRAVDFHETFSRLSGRGGNDFPGSRCVASGELEFQNQPLTLLLSIPELPSGWCLGNVLRPCDYVAWESFERAARSPRSSEPREKPMAQSPTAPSNKEMAVVTAW